MMNTEMGKIGAKPLDIPDNIRSEKFKERMEAIKAMQEGYAEEVQEIYDDICIWLATPDDENANPTDIMIQNQNLLLKAARVLLKGNLPMELPDVVLEEDVDKSNVVDMKEDNNES